MIRGEATREGTRAYAEGAKARGYPSTAFRELGRTGLRASVLGFGCYRVHEAYPEHHAALEKALREGCNLIDTSTNYADGGSEVCVGQVVRKLVGESALRRDSVVVVSKAGYVQGANLDVAMEREAAGTPFPEMVKYMEGCWHCLHPEFLSDQLDRSLTRLGLAKLDALLLHNPEYFFSDAERRGATAPTPDLLDAFYDRIRRAFLQLEEEVAKGRISAYGVSSNSFGGGADELGTTSLTRLWEIAREVGAQRHGHPDAHHFSIVQLPLNLFESGPALEHNNGPEQRMTALEFAREKRLGVLVNRPLNAFVANQLLRLSDQAMAGHRDVAQVLHSRLDALLPEPLHRESLSRKALATLVHTPGVTSVLVGMRQTGYVDDAMGAERTLPFTAGAELYRSFRFA